MKNKFDFQTIVIAILVSIFFSGAAIFALHQFDLAWEARAKAAGYYDTLPDNLKNPKDIK